MLLSEGEDTTSVSTMETSVSCPGTLTQSHRRLLCCVVLCCAAVHSGGGRGSAEDRAAELFCFTSPQRASPPFFFQPGLQAELQNRWPLAKCVSSVQLAEPLTRASLQCTRSTCQFWQYSPVSTCRQEIEARRLEPSQWEEKSTSLFTRRLTPWVGLWKSCFFFFLKCHRNTDLYFIIYYTFL